MFSLSQCVWIRHLTDVLSKSFTPIILQVTLLDMFFPGAEAANDERDLTICTYAESSTP